MSRSNHSRTFDLNFKLGCIATLLISSFLQASALHCYNCEPSSPACQDPIDKSEVHVKECGSAFSIGPALIRRAYNIRANESDNSPIKRNMLSEEEYEADDLNHHNYVCVKITLEGHDVDRSPVSGTIRGCFIDKQDVCHLIGSVVTDVTANLVRSTSCSICKTDYCNAANETSISLILCILSIIFIFILKN